MNKSINQFILQLGAEKINEMIGANGFDAKIVSIASSSNELFSYIRNNPSQYLIFLDLDFGSGKLNGIDVAKTLRHTESDCKIVFTTNHHEMAMDVLKSGVEPFSFLEKSSDISKLADGYRKYIVMLLNKTKSEASNTMDYFYGNYSETDKEYFMALNEKITTPFHYAYNTGWNKLLGISYVSLMIIALVVCIALVPIFSSECQTGADAILLSTKYGRSKLIVAKIVSSFLLTSVIYVSGMFILMSVTFLIYGSGGAGCSLQVLNFLAPADVNLLQAYLYVLLAGYFMCLFMQGITLLLSAKMPSPFLYLHILTVFPLLLSSISSNSLICSSVKFAVCNNAATAFVRFPLK